MRFPLLGFFCWAVIFLPFWSFAGLFFSNAFLSDSFALFSALGFLSPFSLLDELLKGTLPWTLFRFLLRGFWPDFGTCLDTSLFVACRVLIFFADWLLCSFLCLSGFHRIVLLALFMWFGLLVGFEFLLFCLLLSLFYIVFLLVASVFFVVSRGFFAYFIKIIIWIWNKYCFIAVQ